MHNEKDDMSDVQSVLTGLGQSFEDSDHEEENVDRRSRRLEEDAPENPSRRSNLGERSSPGVPSPTLPTAAPRTSSYGGNDASAPSRVLHVRNLPHDVLKYQFEDILSAYGKVVVSVKVKNKNQALVQMATVEEAQKVMDAVRPGNPPLMLGQFVLKLGFSKSQTLKLAHRPPEANTVSVPSSNPAYRDATARRLMEQPQPVPLPQQSPQAGGSLVAGGGGPPAYTGICLEFQKGHCSRGAACRYAHEPLPREGASRGGGGGGGVPTILPGSVPVPAFLMEGAWKEGGGGGGGTANGALGGGSGGPGLPPHPSHHPPPQQHRPPQQRLSDAELVEAVGRRSTVDPAGVVLFRARADYLALVGEDVFGQGPHGRGPLLNINEREEHEGRHAPAAAASSRQYHASHAGAQEGTQFQLHLQQHPQQQQHYYPHYEHDPVSFRAAPRQQLGSGGGGGGRDNRMHTDPQLWAQPPPSGATMMMDPRLGGGGGGGGKQSPVYAPVQMGSRDPYPGAYSGRGGGGGYYGGEDGRGAYAYGEGGAEGESGSYRDGGGGGGGYRGGDRNGDRYGDRNGDRNGDRYGDRNGERYGDRNGDRYGDRNGDGGGDHGRGRDGYYDESGGDASRSRRREGSRSPMPERPRAASANGGGGSSGGRLLDRERAHRGRRSPGGGQSRSPTRSRSRSRSADSHKYPGRYD